MAINSEDNLYMSEAEGDRVYKFSASELRLDASGDVRSFVPGSLVGWTGSCTFGSGCDSVNERTFGYTCTDGGPAFCSRDAVSTATEY